MKRSTPTWRLPTHKRPEAADRAVAEDIGKRFGNRVVIAVASPYLYDNGQRIAKIRRVVVRCDCGDERKVIWSALKQGKADMCYKCSMLNQRKKPGVSS